MHRPQQRTLIKSTKLFPYSSFKKVLAPQHFLQQLETCMAQQMKAKKINYRFQQFQQSKFNKYNDMNQQKEQGYQRNARLTLNLNIVSQKCISGQAKPMAKQAQLYQSLNTIQNQRTDALCDNSNIQSNLLNKNKQTLKIGMISSQKNSTINMKRVSASNSRFLKDIINGKNYTCTSASLKGSIVSGRSFKIRNVGAMRAKKQNQRCASQNKDLNQYSCAVNKNQMVNYGSLKQLKLVSFSQNLNLLQICEKIEVFPIYQQNNCENYCQPQNVNRLRQECKDQHSQCVFIISQSIFYGHLHQQTNILKISSLIDSLNKKSQNFSIYIKIKSYNKQMLQIFIKRIMEKGIKLSGLLIAKNKHIENMNIYNLSDVRKNENDKNFIIVQDTHQLTKNIYFDTLNTVVRQNINHNGYSHNEEINKSSKYLYLKFRGFGNLIKFVQNLYITEQNKEFQFNILQNHEFFQYENQSQKITRMTEIREKIKIFSSKCVIRKIREKIKQQAKQKQKETAKRQNNLKNSKIELKRKSEDVSKQILSPLQQMRAKLSKFATNILKRQSKQQRTSQNHRKPSTNESKTRTNKSQSKISVSKPPLNIISYQTKGNNDNFGKPANAHEAIHQYLQQLINNNQSIHKQISKFHEKSHRQLTELQFHHQQLTAKDKIINYQ